ncbi:DUF4996 domain-containing protein [Aestuariivivens sediminis]|uniref:DUF4996 domain-containing protein n=1 Tax=Aestuariivivens sediminis TaxID=2913557 RepID=UPI001F5863D9
MEVLQNSFDAVEFRFSSDPYPEVEKLIEFQRVSTRVWVNVLWPDHNKGHHDDRALKEPDAAFGRLISKGINIIQTECPKLLLEYLRSKNLHD